MALIDSREHIDASIYTHERPTDEYLVITFKGTVPEGQLIPNGQNYGDCWYDANANHKGYYLLVPYLTAKPDSLSNLIFTTVYGIAEIQVDASYIHKAMPARQTSEQIENVKRIESELDEAQLQNEVICINNGGHLPANWPTNPPHAGQMSNDQVKALQVDAERRLTALRASNNGQLPSDWRNHVLQVGGPPPGYPAKPVEDSNQPPAKPSWTLPVTDKFVN